MYSILLIFLRIIHTSIMGRYNIIFTCNVSNDPFSIEKKRLTITHMLKISSYSG